MNESVSTKLQTCRDLLEVYKSKNLDLKGEKLNFTGVQGRDVYNIT